MSNDRENSIAFVADLVQKLCIETNICLFPKKLDSGQLIVAIHDNLENKDYYIINNK